MKHICDCGEHYSSLGVLEACQLNNHGRGWAPSIGAPLAIRIEEGLRMYGIKCLLNAMIKATERRAQNAVGNFNTVQAKQWAAWAVALEALRDDRKLTDPGRE